LRSMRRSWETLDLLSYGIAQAFAVAIVIFVGERRASFRQPLITDYGFERAALTIDRPDALTHRGETAEPAAATAASVD